MIPVQFQKIKALADQLNTEISQVTTETFKEFFGAWFQEHPTVTAVRWTQYTPYFNDGDACVFGVNEPELQIKPDPAAEPAVELEIADEDEKWIQSWDSTDKVLVEAIGEVYTLLQNMESACRQAFGDGVQVTVTPDEIAVEDYNHD